MDEQEFHHMFRESYYEYEEARCNCGTVVDFSEAEDIDEAAEMWNDHVRSVHSDREK